MSRQISGTARILSLANDVLLDLNDGDAYVLASWSDDEEVADSVTEESGYVDGDAEISYRLTATIIEVQVRVKGTTYAQVEGRRKALSDAVKAAPVWLLQRELEGVSVKWRARRPIYIGSPIDSAGIANRRRTVTLRIPVQPNPTVTGLEP